MPRSRPSIPSAGRLAAFAVLATLVACGSPATPRDPEPVDGGLVSAATVVLDDQGEPAGLHHHHRWSPRIGQGAEPHGEVAFANLRALGYDTVLSVDGARPDVDAAERHGLRYVHVPIGYDGIEEGQALQIVKAVQESRTGTYVHCHHGRHRGPAGAMVARIALDGISNEEAVEELKVSGCSPKYAGLYRDVEAFRKPTVEALATVTELHSFVAPEGLVAAMADVSRRMENMKMVREAAWQVPPSNPDVSPTHEATLVWEGLREMQRLDEAQGYGDDFLGLLAGSEAQARQMEAALLEHAAERAEAAYNGLLETCNTCHTKYRN